MPYHSIPSNRRKIRFILLEELRAVTIGTATEEFSATRAGHENTELVDICWRRRTTATHNNCDWMLSIESPSTQMDRQSTLTKDQNYYFDNGDCIIQAGECLFKIHQFLLERDSQIFKDMFSLPQPHVSVPEGSIAPGTTLEGKHEEHPLVFQDFTDDFRALCWALYARPNDILNQQQSTTVDLLRMTRLLMMSHKYEIRYLWHWSLRVIKDHLSSFPRKLFSSGGGSWTAAERLLNLSNHSPDAVFIGQSIEEEWLRQIQSSNLAQARAAFTAALDAAERSPTLHEFHAKAYHTYVKAVGKVHVSTSVDMSNGASFVDSVTSSLNELRTTRLCRGFWSLSQLRLKLSVPPEIKDNPSCAIHATVCVPSWKAWWSQNLVRDQTDPRDLIQTMRDRATSNNITHTEQVINYRNRMTTTTVQIVIPCSAPLLEQFNGMVKEFDNTLADHFMLPRSSTTIP